LRLLRSNEYEGIAMLPFHLDLIALGAVSACGVGFFVWTLCQLLSVPRSSAGSAKPAEQAQ
jgi:hypothetical protein